MEVKVAFLHSRILLGTTVWVALSSQRKGGVREEDRNILLLLRFGRIFECEVAKCSGLNFSHDVFQGFRAARKKNFWVEAMIMNFYSI